jgi:hypothetical protein
MAKIVGGGFGSSGGSSKEYHYIVPDNVRAGDALTVPVAHPKSGREYTTMFRVGTDPAVSDYAPLKNAGGGGYEYRTDRPNSGLVREEIGGGVQAGESVSRSGKVFFSGDKRTAVSLDTGALLYGGAARNARETIVKYNDCETALPSQGYLNYLRRETGEEHGMGYLEELRRLM